jgi:hypothetical protein
VIVGVAVARWVPCVWLLSDARVVVSRNSSEVRLPDCLSAPLSGTSEETELRTLAVDLLASMDEKIGAEMSKDVWVGRRGSPIDK